MAVELGLQDDVMQVVEITAGLAAGDTVLVGGLRRRRGQARRSES